MVWPLWAYSLLSQGIVGEVFAQYWPMSVAMLLGSFVAGSTPLGGGIVAYPVCQLVLFWPTPDSRDASILVQSIGMNAAGYLLLLRKRHLLHYSMIFTFTVWGGVGILLGLMVASPSDVLPTEWRKGTLPPGLANIIFGTLVLCFAIMYCYVSELLPKHTEPHRRQDGSICAKDPHAVVKLTTHACDADSIYFKELDDTSPVPSVTGVGERLLDWLPLHAAMIVFALCGGFLTANVGSGSDMALYIFGVFVWNPARPLEAQTETALTASSVVVMGILSAVASVARAVNGGFARKILLCWGADAFIVVLGAPIGAYVLTPSAAVCLRRLFYIMALVQFVNFTFMEDAFFDATVAPYVGKRVWLVIGPLLLGEFAMLAWHYNHFHRVRAPYDLI